MRREAPVSRFGTVEVADLPAEVRERLSSAPQDEVGQSSETAQVAAPGEGANE